MVLARLLFSSASHSPPLPFPPFSFVRYLFLFNFIPPSPCSIPVSFVLLLLLLVRSIKVYALPSTRLASPSHLFSHFFFSLSPPDISSSTNRKARQLRFSQSSFPLLCREHQLFYGERTRMHLGACTSTPTDTPKNWLYTCTATHTRTHARTPCTREILRQRIIHAHTRASTSHTSSRACIYAQLATQTPTFTVFVPFSE